MITGKVIDTAYNETLPGANVYFSDAAGTPGSATKGTATDSNGNFLFDKVYGEHLTASFLGYKRQTKKAVDGEMIFYLDPQAITLPEIEIIGQRPQPKKLTYFTTKNLLIGGAILTIAAAMIYLIKTR